ncbi:hypothetical protein PFICI_09531 [Pestalotiopsis fici W106-1]|uniref:Uncharacterized protein n=1 Tax=Pestalotiopsis fici (strain W106-1 / CGMCC3.15140) TaxID=1229662 RepID=W3X0L8_PESFW|nr:uncharacterized protein PFICI_09531 [Pestalotiopsis fici W106-1]ETS79678.1 hypothetical protein PFICI_09531 [Pestalotiopsis fici W106-1]
MEYPMNDPTVALLRDVFGAKRQLILRMVESDDSLEPFLIGPTFCASHRQLLISVFTTSTTVLQDALLASSTAWMDDMSMEPCDAYQKASSALSKLSALEVKNQDDATTCLTLGALIHTFALKLRVGDIYLICSEALGRIKPIYESEHYSDSPSFFMLTCMVAHEILECLVRCCRPMLRYKPSVDPTRVDRFVGLSGTLLPLLQDICELNAALSCVDRTGGAEVNAALLSVEQAVMDWFPPVPSGFTSLFTSMETTHMLCQARVTRMAALMIIHRLRHPFGRETGSALAMASTIMHELEITQQITGKQAKCVDLAILVACLEFEGNSRDSWIHKTERLLGYSMEYKARIQGIIKSFWAAKDRGQDLFWYDLSTVA